MPDRIKRAADMLSNARKVTVLTGAGISAESNVPTFRGKDGLWKNFRPEDLATPEAFKRDPKLVWEWYKWRRGIVTKCRTNPAHEVIAKMESRFSSFTLVTQNVDGLHRRAGNKNVLELHGNLFKARCTKEGTIMDLDQGDDPLPKCPDCGALLRPHIVWFGESLDPEILQKAFAASVSCDIFLVAGTSAIVQPAATLPLYARQSGAPVIEVNLERTALSSMVNISLTGKAGEILPRIWEQMGDCE